MVPSVDRDLVGVAGPVVGDSQRLTALPGIRRRGYIGSFGLRAHLITVPAVVCVKLDYRGRALTEAPRREPRAAERGSMARNAPASIDAANASRRRNRRSSVRTAARRARDARTRVQAQLAASVLAGCLLRLGAGALVRAQCAPYQPGKADCRHLEKQRKPDVPRHAHPAPIVLPANPDRTPSCAIAQWERPANRRPGAVRRMPSCA